MASVEKFTDEAVSNQLRHNDRQIKENSNKDIDPSRSGSNSSFPLNHSGLTDFEYYQKRIGESYLYGRGTAREKKAVTACGWVVTLPKEITGIPEKEESFFRGVLNFITHRYGERNIINNSIHRDEGGQPHIHVIFTPIVPLDHDQVHFKTVKTKTAVQTETGRYEFAYRYKLDANGEKIPLNNYAKMSDYFDEKISAAEILNTAELKHFHNDLQKYLTDHGIEGIVVNGSTNGKNMTVKSMKEFTRATGMTINEARSIQADIERLKNKLTRSETLIADLSSSLSKKDETIQHLQEKITKKDHDIKAETEKIKDLSKEVQKGKTLAETLQKSLSAEKSLSGKIEEKYAAEQIRNRQLEKQLKQAEKEIENLKNKNIEITQDKEWGSSSGWGSDRSAWENNITQEVEKTW